MELFAGIPQSTLKSIGNGESKTGIVTLKKLYGGLDITPLLSFFDTADLHQLEQELK